ncbi:unnamed protein product [Brassica oleracea]|uniref:(rape) hypothetical protein n=1 Tax=Brassica napus TaxID=3708 RepID=A0A816L6M7_BRANA|nr:unnamed protein product [Brassica napus]
MHNSLALSKNKFDSSHINYATVGYFFLSNHDHAFVKQSQREKTEPTSSCHHHMSSCFERWLSATSLSETAQAGAFSRHHSLTSIHANNLLDTHNLNTRLRVGNCSVNMHLGTSLN